MISSWPHYSKEEIDAVTKVLTSGQVNYWTGNEGRSFEYEFAEFCGVKHAVALTNGTMALEIALRVLEIGPGDEVVITPRTFVASASAINMVGARPIFADVDSKSQNITPETIRPVLTDRTRAIIAVHLAGWPCDMDGIKQLAGKHELYVIEDCAQAHGAIYKGQSVGGIGHVAAWSFCQDKIMSTGGEGGMLTTNDREIWEKAWSFKDHGKIWESVDDRGHPTGFRWLHESFGTNGRMTEFQAVIGRKQIKRMPEWHALRKRNAEAILSTCDQFPNVLDAYRPPAYIEHAWYKCYVFVGQEGLRPGWTRNRILNEFNALGVPCYSGSCPEVYLEKAFDGTGWRPEKRLPVARVLGETSLMFPVHPTLTDKEILTTCNAIKQVFQSASKPS